MSIEEENKTLFTLIACGLGFGLFIFIVRKLLGRVDESEKNGFSLKYHILNIYVIMPFNFVVMILLFIGTSSMLDFVYAFIEILLMAIAFFGLVKFKKYGYYRYMASSIVAMVYLIISMGSGTGDSSSGTAFFKNIWDVVYYYKRRSLFGFGIEQLDNGKTSVDSLENNSLTENNNNIEPIVEKTIKEINNNIETNKEENLNPIEKERVDIVNNIEELSETEIKYCRKCGTKLNANSMYCHKCGTKVV